MILDITTYKDYKNVGTLDNEAQIELIIDSVNDRIEAYCRQAIDTPNNELKLIAVEMTDTILNEINGIDTNGEQQVVESQSLEGNSITFSKIADKLISKNKQELAKYRVMY